MNTRSAQRGLFLIGVILFLAALGFVGTSTGDDLWRAGIAVMLTVSAWGVAWPAGPRT